jgi:hypothetical protein
MTSGYISIELPSSVPGIGYTLKHRNAVEELIKYYCKKVIGKVDGNGISFTQQDYVIMCNRAKCHDMDKLVTSLAYPQITADYLHRLFNGHHEESMIEPTQKSKYDWMEMIFDMESAKYTKPDKQSGGAYAYASQYKTYIMQYLMPYFILFDLNKPDTGIIDTIKVSVNRKYYESDLVDAIINYIHTTHIHLLDGVSRIDDEGFMKKFGQPAPYRHASTQHPNGTYHRRPAPVCNASPNLMRLELMNGTFNAQIFDMDKICQIPASNVKNVNNSALNALKQMGREFQR